MGPTFNSDDRFLITGGAGFIGSNLAHHLAEQGARVRILDDFSTGRRENLEGLEGRVEIVEGSIVDPLQCAEATRGVRYVLHQAAIPSVPRSVAHPFDSHEACATGTLNMLIAARNEGVSRFVYASSSSAYGNATDDWKSEDLPVNPLSPYAVAKLTGEQYARIFASIYGLETVCLRYFNIFGPRQDPDSPYSAVIPLFIGHALTGSSPTINGDGGQTRDFTYVANAIRANLQGCTAEARRVTGEVFNVGCGDQISVLELWERIKRAVGSESMPQFGPPRPGDVRDSLASIERATELLGYEVEVPLNEGLRRTVRWYQDLT